MNEHVRRALGLSQRRLARELGISARSLMRYIKGERKPSESVALRLQVAAEDIAPSVEEYATERAARDRVPVVPVKRAPVLAHRYKRAPSLIGPTEESEIVLVDVKGLSNVEVGEIVTSYWRELSKTGRDWNIRFLLRVSVEEYFEGEKPDNEEIRRSIRGRSHISLWIPPQHFAFVRRRGRDISSIVHFSRSSDVLEYLNERLAGYANRVPEDFGFEKIAFIPYRTDTDGKRKRRYQKRRGKH